MSLVQGKQPVIRFDVAGPFGFQGISFEPKVIVFRKDAITGASNNDFWVAPAGTYISQAFLRCDEALNATNAAVTLGTDGSADALINATDFDCTTAGNWASSFSSTTNMAGLYLDSGDTIRLAIAGAGNTTGEVSGFIVYYEFDAMKTDGIHFDIA